MTLSGQRPNGQRPLPRTVQSGRYTSYREAFLSPMLSLKALIIISETQQKSQETEIKLQVLMDAMTNQQPSGPRPIHLESTTSASQQTMSAQRQFQWQQSSQGRNEVISKNKNL